MFVNDTPREGGHCGQRPGRNITLLNSGLTPGGVDLQLGSARQYPHNQRPHCRKWVADELEKAATLTPWPGASLSGISPFERVTQYLLTDGSLSERSTLYHTRGLLQARNLKQESLQRPHNTHVGCYTLPLAERLTLSFPQGHPESGRPHAHQQT